METNIGIERNIGRRYNIRVIKIFEFLRETNPKRFRWYYDEPDSGPDHNTQSILYSWKRIGRPK